MEYASVDELRKSVMQVSDFRGGLNQAKIISHSDESRSRPDHGVNEESMQDFRRYLRMDEDFIPRPSYHNYEYGHRRPSSMGRGKLLRQAAEMSGNYNLQSIRDRKVKQQMYEAGICSGSISDMKASFYEIFKSEDDEIEEEEDSGSKSTTQSTTSGDISSSEQEVDDLVGKFSNSPSLSDVNNNDNRGRGRTSKSSVYLPPHRRKEEVGEPVEAVTAVVEKKEGIVFADLIRKREQKKSQAPPAENVKRRTIAELLADPGWNEKPKGETATPPPKCRNAVMAQFLPKNEAETESREASPPICLIPDDKVPVARRLMDSFVPPEEPKPRQFTLEDFIIKTSPKKNSKK